jgi:ATP diphosphatase
MPVPPPDDPRPIDRLLAVMAALRQPETGCPWDLEQDFRTIAPYTVEEAYEVADAIERGDMDALEDECGDLLFQVVYYAQMASERGAFSFEDVAARSAAKMVRRHPHVFAEDRVDGAGHMNRRWEDHKEAERAAAAGGERKSALDGVPRNLPALLRALKLTKRAGRVGFDWASADEVFAKLDEEIGELKAEIAAGAPAERLQDELGDILFAVANLARKLGVDPEVALRGTNAKFERRFRRIEDVLAERGTTPAESTLEEMEAIWQAAKGG